jgi:formylglycine-generating enzyme required for sulfatase activity
VLLKRTHILSVPARILIYAIKGTTRDATSGSFDPYILSTEKTTSMKKLFFTLTSLFALATAASANNIQVTGVSVSGQNTASDYTMVNFSVDWENSWRTSTNESNYDGAWLFVKFRKANSSIWKHATLNYVAPGSAAASGHTEPIGSTLQTYSDSKGVMIYRNANGIGNVSFSGASLRWNYGVDGVLDNDSVEVRVYAVEMVYITQGQFYLGSGGTETGAFKTSTTTAPYLVTSENAITVGSGAGNLNYSVSATTTGDGLGPIPANFPKGFNPYWIMKYEGSQQAYVDFLNTLDATKAASHNNPGYAGTPYNFVPFFADRPVGSINKTDFMAFLDWSALRPMTELEYEKACRGYNMLPVADEYAWGNTTIIRTSSVNNPGTSAETPVSGNANYYVNFSTNLSRPVRNGAWANDTTTTREQTGGSYYGVMEMTSNQYEYAVTVGTVLGRGFVPNHGDGELNAAGNADVTGWDLTGAALGLRGGGYGETAVMNLKLSFRGDAVSTTNVVSGAFSIRGVRTAQ